MLLRDMHFEMYVDDVRLQGQVGYLVHSGKAMTENFYYLNTHLHFDIAYNDVDMEKGKFKVRHMGSGDIVRLDACCNDVIVLSDRWRQHDDGVVRPRP